MKRILALVLLLAALASMIVVPVSAAEKTPEQLAEMQQAVVETVMAFWRKNHWVDYETASLTILPRDSIGVARITSGDTPEMAAKDYFVCSHCADWCNTVYLNAFNHNVAGSARRAQVVNFNINMKPNKEVVVLKFGPGGISDRAEFEKQFLELLQPGDIWAASNYPDYSNGHAILYVGDVYGDGKKYVVHSSGTPGDEDSGLRGAESAGLRMDPIDFLVTGTWGIRNESRIKAITILRPTNVLNYEDITPSAKQRLVYKNIDINRESDLYAYNSVQNGQRITVSLTIKNNSTEAYTGVAVSDPYPQNGVIVPDSANEGGVISYKGVEWTVDVPAGEEKTLTYQVQAQGDLGSTLLLPKGTVGAIPTRDLSYTIGGKPIVAAPLATIAGEKKLEGMGSISDIAFASEFYKLALGIDLQLPATMQDVLNGLFDVVVMESAGKAGGAMLQPKEESALTEEFKRLNSMILPDHKTGHVVYMGTDPDTYYPHDRVVTYIDDYYLPGDIFLAFAGERSYAVKDAKDVVVYIYLGDGKVALQTSVGFTVSSFGSTIETAQRMNALVALRPSLVYEDIMSLSTLPLAAEEGPELFPALEVPEAPVEPEAPTEPETPGETPEAPEAPAEAGSSMGIILGAAAAVVVLAVVLVLVLKKKKA